MGRVCQFAQPMAQHPSFLSTPQEKSPHICARVRVCVPDFFPFQANARSFLLIFFLPRLLIRALARSLVLSLQVPTPLQVVFEREKVVHAAAGSSQSPSPKSQSLIIGACAVFSGGEIIFFRSNARWLEKHVPIKSEATTKMLCYPLSIK